MQRLADCLCEIESSGLPEDMDVRLTEHDHPVVDEVVFIATRLFIDDKGNPLFELMDQLQHEHGYYIFPGERDSFGWVTACLQTKKGFIVFG